MMLKINKSSSLNSLQKHFNEAYPFLKIEFYKKIPKGQCLYKAELIATTESAKQVESFYEGISINISSSRPVTDVEREFESIFGFPTHVFRKSGNVWVETTLTNDWSLGEQNREGKQISSHFLINKGKE